MTIYGKQEVKTAYGTVTVETIPFDAPGPRHTKCGDWVEGDGDLLVCKTCGTVPQNQVEVY